MTSPLQAAYNEVALTNSRLRSALEMSELARDRAVAEIERLRSNDRAIEISHRDAEIERLKAMCADLGKAAMDVGQQLKNAEAENERLKEHLATNDRILDHVRKELAKDSSLVNELSADNVRLDRERREEIQRLNAHINKLDAQIEQLRRKSDEAAP